MTQLRYAKNLLMLLLASLPVLAAVFYLVATGIIRHQQEELLEKGCARTYRFSAKDVVWLRPGKEIRVNGRLMDLFSCRQSGNLLEVTGIWDEEETALHEQLKRQPLPHGSQAISLQLLTLFFTPTLPQHPYRLNLIPEKPHREYARYRAAFTPAVFSSIPLPPPRPQTSA